MNMKIKWIIISLCIVALVAAAISIRLNVRSVQGGVCGEYVL